MVGVARNSYGVGTANQYTYYKLTPPRKQTKNTKAPNSDPEVTGCCGVWWTHAETSMKSVSLTAGDCHTGLDSSRTNCLLQRYKFSLSLGLPLLETKEKVAVVQSKQITIKAACFPLVLGTLVTWHQWPALSPGNHKWVQDVSCFSMRSRCWVRCNPRVRGSGPGEQG